MCVPRGKIELEHTALDRCAEVLERTVQPIAAAVIHNVVNEDIH
jgi:hypothetical protein